MKLVIGGWDAAPTQAAEDGDTIDGIPRDLVEYEPGLLIVFYNYSTNPHSVSIGKTTREGEIARPYDWCSYVISPGRTSYKSDIIPQLLLVGPFDTYVPVEDLSELGVLDGDVQIRYLSGTEGLRISAIKGTI